MQVKYKFCVLQFSFFSLKFVETVFVSSFDLPCASESTTSSHTIDEPSIILAEYFPVSQLLVAGFQT